MLPISGNQESVGDRVDDAPLLSDNGCIALRFKPGHLVFGTCSLIGVPCRFRLPFIFVIIIFPETEFRSFRLVVEPVVPLDSLYAFQSIDLLPAVCRSCRLVRKDGIIIRVICSPRTDTGLRKPYLTHHCPLVPVGIVLHPSVKHLKVLHGYIIGIH